MPVWHSSCFIESVVIEGQNVLRISFLNLGEASSIKLEGRVAGPWVSELNRAWLESSPNIASKKVVIDLQNVTYADRAGKEILRRICQETGAELIANTPWSQFLAEEISAREEVIIGERE